MTTILNALVAIVKAIKDTNPILTGGFGVIGFLLTAFQFVNDLWAVLLAKIAAVAMPSAVSGGAIQFLGFMNYFLPITEVLTFFSAYVALYLACATIRIVKSFVPTIAS